MTIENKKLTQEQMQGLAERIRHNTIRSLESPGFAEGSAEMTNLMFAYITAYGVETTLTAIALGCTRDRDHADAQAYLDSLKV